MNEPLTQLLDLSHALGNPARDWAILGEGNTSTALNNDAFLVKASGSQLATLTAGQVATVRFPRSGGAGRARTLSDQETKDLLLSSCVGDGGRMPSVETLLHAYLLTLPGVEFVGHTHVTSINGVLCSAEGWAVLERGERLFPDEIVVCGVAPCCIPYVDPGLPLARALRARWSRSWTTLMPAEDDLPPQPRLHRAGQVGSGSPQDHDDGGQGRPHPDRRPGLRRPDVPDARQRRPHPVPARRALPPESTGPDTMTDTRPLNAPSSRLRGSLPKIGIRPTIDGRYGGVRESLEEQTMGMARRDADADSGPTSATPAGCPSKSSSPTPASAASPRRRSAPRSSPARASASR